MHLRNGKRRMPSSWTVISPISTCVKNALEVFFFYSKIDSLFAVNEKNKEAKKKLKIGRIIGNKIVLLGWLNRS